jgi:hypothetical protein
MADKDIYQHVPEGTASDRVAEKAKLVEAKLKLVNEQNAAERALYPPAPAPKASKAKAADAP